MNWSDALLWGFAATVVLTGLMAASQQLGWSRMAIPFMLGTMFTADRLRASVLGLGVHFLNGWLFAFLYALLFESLQRATWYYGAATGLAHGLFVLGVTIPLLPAIHPRMASEYHGPRLNKGLQPPGFFALNYGRRTPAVTLVAHLLYGVILGVFYQVS